jgi:RNA polymerase primary sigma factor
MYYGINYSREFTLDEIGKELKLTRERVRQIKNKSLRKLLRSKDSKEKLFPFVGEE